MPRADIWQDGVNTRFSQTNQPANRGRKKGQRNRATICREVFAFLDLLDRTLDQQQRDHRNARRREHYHQKKRAGGTTHPTL